MVRHWVTLFTVSLCRPTGTGSGDNISERDAQRGLHSRLHECSSLYNRLQALQRFAKPPAPGVENYGSVRRAPTMGMGTHTHGAARAALVVCVHMQAGARRSKRRTKPMSCCRIQDNDGTLAVVEKKKRDGPATSFH